MLGFSIISLLIVWLYWKLRNAHNFWKLRGVPGPPPEFLLGNMRQLLSDSRAANDLRWSRQYGKMFGYYGGLKPQLVVTDHELIRQILVKDFVHFANRQKLNAYHEMWNENMFNTEDEHWRRIRAITSPAFTSGKLKNMHNLMRKCIEKFVAYLDRIAQGEQIIQNTKDAIAGFTIDVIASTSFATETNANDDREGQNPFVVNGKDFFNVNPFRAFAAFTLPRPILDLLGIKTFINQGAFQFFIDLTTEIVRRRKLSQTKRNDLVQLLVDMHVDEEELKNLNLEKLTASNEKEQEEIPESTEKNVVKSKKVTLTEKEIVAQCILFFTGGFETTASTILHCLYELAKNPEIQERLFTEIHQATENLDESSDEYFDTVVNQIPYLEATIKETLRMYPPVVILFRRVTTDGYKLNGVSLPKDTPVEISVYAVHHNQDYYDKPQQFDPERFMPANKHKLVPYTYLPFGAGPRNCLGMRFAYQEVKLCLAKLVQRYRFGKTPGMPEKLQFQKGLPLLVTSTFPTKIEMRF